MGFALSGCWWVHCGEIVKVRGLGYLHIENYYCPLKVKKRKKILVSGEAVAQGVGIVATAQHGHSKGSFAGPLPEEPLSLNIDVHTLHGC